jgi:hypothetical protein
MTESFRDFALFAQSFVGLLGLQVLLRIVQNMSDERISD